MYMIGFIHITKTGGTDLKDKNKDKNIICRPYHHEDGKFYKNKGIPCFCILREPIDRFISLFIYNTKGSNKHRKYDNINDINKFVENMRNNKSYLNKYENGWQFRKQYEWLNGDPENTYILKYYKENNTNIKNFLKKEFNINYIYENNRKINVSNYNENININMTENNINYIKKIYNEDMLLYKKLDKLNVNYAKLCKIISFKDIK